MGVTRVVGLAGYRHAGKSTISAEMLRRGLADDRVSFAAPLRDIAWYILEHTLGQDEDRHLYELKDQPVPGHKWTGRDLLIKVGDACRALDPLFFVKLAERAIGPKLPGIVVLDDLRLVEEAEMIHRLGGICLWVDRGGSAGNHSTEDGKVRNVCDGEIDNTGSIKGAVMQVEKFMVRHVVE